ncbi:excalibur calcium-binding domain-containing protein [Streptomyces sp. NPDC048352]|uniref:excalibur calcium-binding domain-containing protein n=1 Tax=Streptomyces sp. NPDC048352 TaxID=3154718 RepID=UPI00341B337A
MFQRRGVAVVGVVGAVVLLLGGCEDGAPKKGAAGGKPGTAPPASASASAGASAPSVMPAVVGQKSAAAEALVRQVVSTPVEARGAYAGVTPAKDHSEWEVCFQTPAAGTAVTAGTAVELSLVAPGTSCPDRAGAPASTAPKSPKSPESPTVPAPAPTPPKPKPKPATEGPTDGSTGGSGAEGVYYKSCDAARAAGVAPMRRGQPGYREGLDRDKDGIACDK